MLNKNTNYIKQIIKIFYLKMYNQKDSLLTLNINLSIKNNSKDCFMIYRPINKSISIFESKTRKIIHTENQVNLIDKNSIIQDFIIGKTIQLIINSNLKASALITGYCDQFTKNIINKQSNNSSSLFFMIKPGFIEKKKLGQIFTVIEKQFQILRFKMFILTKQNLSKYIVNEKMQNSQNQTINFEYLTSGHCFGFQLKGDKVLARLNKIVGPQNPIQARKVEPLSIRAKYGINIIQNCCYMSKNQKAAANQLDFIFSLQVKQQIPKLNNTCLCLIKPHIIQQKQVGQLLTTLLQNSIYINCMRFQQLKSQLIKKYLDLYKFLPEYNENIKHFSEDKCLFMQIVISDAKNTVQQFKKICGPYDPSYAKKINPKSIRSIYGINRVLNAVHCTQLNQDSESELKIIFQC